MPHLAERKRKQVISVDPQNKQWTEDRGKYGERMLCKMGWSRGNGLGCGLSGVAEPIQPTGNSDKRGLGSGASSGDAAWLSHVDGFDAILSRLNGTPAASDTGEGDAAPAQRGARRAKVVGAERKSYKKTVRGKDLSGKSSDDVRAVLGDRTLRPAEASERADSGGKAKRRKAADCAKSERPHESQSDCASLTVSRVDVHSVYKERMREKLAALMKKKG